MAQFTWDILQKFKLTEELDSSFAFLVLNRPITCQPDLIKTLWNSAAICALADGGSNRWLDFIEEHPSYYLKLPNYISGDFDSIKPRTRKYFESKEVLFISTPDQDETDFSKALRIIGETIQTKNLNIKWVFVLCENGGRFDQDLANLNTLHNSNEYIKDVPVILFSTINVTWVLRPGVHTINTFDETVEKQYSCGLVSLRGPTTVTTYGLKWNLDRQIMEMGGLSSTSNKYVSKQVTVKCDRDLVWTTQYCDINY